MNYSISIVNSIDLIDSNSGSTLDQTLCLNFITLSSNKNQTISISFGDTNTQAYNVTSGKCASFNLSIEIYLTNFFKFWYRFILFPVN